MSSTHKNADFSIRARLCKLPPRDHALMMILPVLVVLGTLQVVTSGGAPAALLSGGIALLLSAVGGFRAYAAWKETGSGLRDEREAGDPT